MLWNNLEFCLPLQIFVTILKNLTKKNDINFATFPITNCDQNRFPLYKSDFGVVTSKFPPLFDCACTYHKSSSSFVLGHLFQGRYKDPTGCRSILTLSFSRSQRASPIASYNHISCRTSCMCALHLLPPRCVIHPSTASESLNFGFIVRVVETIRPV